MVAMFERIGAFHLGTGHEELIAALERELEHTDGTNALIVLPEAFNLGRHYCSEPGIPKFERDVVVSQLSAIARRLAIAFVVGLLEPEPEDSGRPHSSAYFISATQISLDVPQATMGRLRPLFRLPRSPDRANPIIQDDASVIAVICMDGHAEKKRNFVCIPAAMCDTSWFGGATLRSSQNFLKCELNGNGNLILANSDHRGVGSFITGLDWRVLACIEHLQKAETRLLIAHCLTARLVSRGCRASSLRASVAERVYRAPEHIPVERHSRQAAKTVHARAHTAPP
jgi:hypothetical protein